VSDDVARFAAGDISAEEFTERFQTARWYALRSERPGFMAVGKKGAGYIPIFSSLTELARYAAEFPDNYGDGVDWLSTTGDDLLTMLPKGYGLLVDVASEHAVYLEPDALSPQRVLAVRRRPPPPQQAAGTSTEGSAV
jgi:SseB protein N-terminal domain